LNFNPLNQKQIMKKKIILFTCSATMISVMLLSNNSGPASSGNGDRTGRLGTTCGSSGCHSGGGGTTTCTIEVLDKTNGAPVTKFVKDQVYTVKISGTNAALPKFGFQLTCVNGTGAAGTWQNIPSTAHSASVSGLPIIEHHTALSKDGSGNYSVSVDWKATDISSVTFHGIINAVDGTGSTSGDKVSAPVQVTLQNATSVADLAWNIGLAVSPNPVSDKLNLKLADAIPGEYRLVAYDLSGRVMATQILNVTTTAYESAVNTSAWPAGLYYVQLSKDDMKKAVPVIKH
jgi:hypothetical protein